mgnify:CR=1 FL=1
MSCENLKVIELPFGLIEVGNGAFLNCSSLTHIDFPNSVEKIGDYFLDGSGVRSINLSDKITELPKDLTQNCRSLIVIKAKNLKTAPFPFTKVENSNYFINEEFFEEVASEHFDKFNQEGLEYGIEHGDEVIELSEEELQRWIDLLIPHQQEYAQELNEKGLPGDEALQTTLDLIEKYNEEFK